MIRTIENLISIWSLLIVIIIHLFCVTQVKAYNCGGDDFRDSLSTHQWITNQAIDYILSHPDLKASRYPLRTIYVFFLFFGVWYADNTELWCTWDWGSDSASCGCDAIHHFWKTSCIFVDLGFNYCVAYPGGYSAPGYGGNLFSVAQQFWPEPRIVNTWEDIPRLEGLSLVDGGSIKAPGDSESLGMTTLGAEPFCAKLAEDAGITTSSYCPRWPNQVRTDPSKGHHNKYYGIEDISTAMKYLGWALHMAQDLTVPDHVQNKQGHGHVIYENNVDIWIEEGRFNNLDLNIDDLWEYATDDHSVTDFLNTIAEHTDDIRREAWSAYVTEHEVGETYNWAEHGFPMAEKLIPYAIEASIILIERYFREVSLDPDPDEYNDTPASHTQILAHTNTYACRRGNLHDPSDRDYYRIYVDEDYSDIVVDIDYASRDADNCVLGCYLNNVPAFHLAQIEQTEYTSYTQGNIRWKKRILWSDEPLLISIFPEKDHPMEYSICYSVSQGQLREDHYEDNDTPEAAKDINATWTHEYAPGPGPIYHETEPVYSTTYIQGLTIDLAGDDDYYLIPSFANKGDQAMVSLDFDPSKGEIELFLDNSQATNTSFSDDGEKKIVRIFQCIRDESNQKIIRVTGARNWYGMCIRIYNNWHQCVPNIRIYPSEIDFGDVIIGESQIENLIVKNIGPFDFELTVDSYNITGPHASDFDFTYYLNPPHIIHGGHNQTIGITFTPGGPRLRQAILKISSDDPDTPLKNIYLAGIGRPKGDVNRDFVVDGADVQIVFDYYLNDAKEVNMEVADVYYDGVITPYDAQCIYDIYLGIRQLPDSLADLIYHLMENNLIHYNTPPPNFRKRDSCCTFSSQASNAFGSGSSLIDMELINWHTTQTVNLDLDFEPSTHRGSIGDFIDYNILILEDPSDYRLNVRAMGFDIRYDSLVLEYQGYTMGEIASEFGFFDIHNSIRYESIPAEPYNITKEYGNLRIGGFHKKGTVNMSSVIKSETKGNLVTLHFRVIGDDDTTLMPHSMYDHILKWNAGTGKFYYYPLMWMAQEGSVFQPTDPHTANSPVSVTIPKINAPENITLNISTQSNPLPSSYSAGSVPQFYSLVPTNSTEGPIEICIDYDEKNFLNEEELSLLHYENNRWVEITSALDTENNKIYGLVDELHLFTITEPIFPCLFTADIRAEGPEHKSYINEVPVLIGIGESAYHRSMPSQLQGNTVFLKLFDPSSRLTRERYYQSYLLEESALEKKWYMKAGIPYDFIHGIPLQGSIITLSWDMSDLCPIGTFSLWLSNSEGELLSLLIEDMSIISKYKILKPKEDLIKADYFCIVWEKANRISKAISLPAGWSMISLPVKVRDTKVASLFPEAAAVFEFTKKYNLIEPEDRLIQGKGYWIYMPKAKKYTLTGGEIGSYTIPRFPTGWSMIGGGSNPAGVSAESGEIRAIFGYEDNYHLLTKNETLDPCKGYWINLSEPTSLRIEKRAN